jgi:hypothetical protein
MSKRITHTTYLSAALAVASLCMTSPLSAQNATPSGPPDQIKNDLLQIEREIGRANFECDYKYFDRIEGDEFIFTSPSGEVVTKKQDLAGETDCHKFNGSYDLEETQSSLYGNTAVFTGRVTISGKNKEGKSFTHRSRFTDVFTWRDGRWQMTNQSSTSIVTTQ